MASSHQESRLRRLSHQLMSAIMIEPLLQILQQQEVLLQQVRAMPTDIFHVQLTDRIFLRSAISLMKKAMLWES